MRLFYLRGHRAENVPGKYTVGEFWSPETQIDVVGLRSDGWIDLGKCKWGALGSLELIQQELTGKAARYPGQALTIQKRIFTRRPVKANPVLMFAFTISRRFITPGRRRNKTQGEMI